MDWRSQLVYIARVLLLHQGLSHFAAMELRGHKRKKKVMELVHTSIGEPLLAIRKLRYATSWARVLERGDIILMSFCTSAQ
ncbi:hypothetical protein HU200_060652 [Digitaria exilis]|uniref:Uncharacterized protein n=1 Tax=Digitaria exilis TaxID=1010633 RepID=A0A835AG85_9POAL|nr:hypothetical protein HU200_060652 [Digitaria exilis]